ncbi:MAG: HAMP domain-containing histidine kinase [Actinomycetota bacterium]|nr:HAMP domain-containing histidine kinase [Actinomycetota bacterium]
MTRRLTLTMVAVVTGALLLVTVGALFVTRIEARTQARRELGLQALRLARRIETVQRVGLAGVQVALRLEDGSVVCFGPTCRTQGTLPAGMTQADIGLARLEKGKVVTGTLAGLAFAAAPAQRGENLMVVVLTRRLDPAPRVLGPWFLVLVAGIVIATAAVAANLGRRLTRPLREAQAATRRLASGDLTARVPEHDRDGEELVDLARSINAMAEVLERSRGLERQFLLSVSHDLRTPLTSIRGFAEALAEGRATDPAHAASVITSEARRLERLVGDLLELAKLDARRFSLDIRGTDVAEVASDTAEGFRPAADAAGVALTVTASRGAPGLTAAADPDRLAQILANLIENALKFASSSIAVGAGPGGAGRVTIWVEDDGPGISDEERPHVFEPFWSSTRVPARQVGSGLGLAIVSELVEAMGGSVRAEPARAGGTRMVVGLRSWQMAAVPGALP